MDFLDNQEINFTIADLLELPSMDKCQLLAGENNLSQEINGIIVMEATDVEAWLSKGQVLLSSLFPLIHSSESEIITLTEKIKKYGGSGFIVKKDRFMKEIPAALIHGCQINGIPLIQITNETKYAAIQIEVMQILFNEKVMLLDHYLQIHQNFLELSLTQPSIKSILTILESLIENPVSLLDNHPQTIETSAPDLCTSVEIRDRKIIKKEYLQMHYTKELVSSSSDLNKTYQRFIFKIKNIDNQNHYLMVHELSKQINSTDFIAIENATNYLQMELIKSFALSEVKQNYHNDFIDDLMAGKITSQESLQETLAYLKLSETSYYRFVVVQLHEPNSQENLTPEQKTAQKIAQREFVQRFLFYWKDVLYRIRSNRLIFIMKDPKLSLNAFKLKIEASINYILQTKKTPELVYRVGISELTQVNKFPKYSLQALKIIQIASLYKTESFIMSYDDLGFYKVLGDIAQQSELEKLIPSRLLDFQKTNPELIPSLRTYLDTNQHYKKSAELLFIHPKSMKYRINKIQQLLTIDFDNAEEVMQYAFGLRVLAFLSIN